MIRHFLNFFLSLLPPSRMFVLRNWLLLLAGVELGRNVKFCGRGWIFGRGCLRIGSETWLSPGIMVYTHMDVGIFIGSNCDIGPGVEFILGGHNIGNSSRRADIGTAKPITIGNGCWIGAKSIILGGVNIGDGCVVAAGAVVTRDVPPNSLVAGVPARIKRELPA